MIPRDDDERLSDELLERLCWAQLESKLKEMLAVLKREGVSREQVLAVLPRLSEVAARAYLNLLAATKAANDPDHPALRSTH